jgi:hypothetical protein
MLMRDPVGGPGSGGPTPASAEAELLTGGLQVRVLPEELLESPAHGGFSNAEGACSPGDKARRDPTVTPSAATAPSRPRLALNKALQRHGLGEWPFNGSLSCRPDGPRCPSRSSHGFPVRECLGEVFILAEDVTGDARVGRLRIAPARAR